MSRLRTRCPQCKGKLEQGQRIHPECIDAYAEKQAEKAARKKLADKVKQARKERAETKRRKAALRTYGERKAAAQKEINRWIVHVRDKDQPCISCGRHHQGVYHAGHYRSRGSAPHLALDERNLAKQCAPCNLYLHGNLIQYRLGLIERYGVEHVEALEADNEPRHYTGDDLDAIAAEYRARNKAIGKGDR